MLWVSRKLYRGDRPTTFAELQQLKVTDVINLQSGVHEFFNNDEYEIQSGEAFGIKEHNVPCNDYFPPSAATVNRVLDIQIEAKGLVYIHCLHGKDRTGYVCAALRMLDGWTYKRAVDEMFEHGFHKWPYLWWVLFLKRYEIKTKM